MTKGIETIETDLVVGLPDFSDEIAESIKRIDAGMTRLAGGQLNERALILLIADAAMVDRVSVQKVLAGIAKLRNLYVRNP